MKRKETNRQSLDAVERERGRERERGSVSDKLSGTLLLRMKNGVF